MQMVYSYIILLTAFMLPCVAVNYVCTTILTVGPQWLPWCGYLVNTATLEIRVDYSRYSFTGKWSITHYMGRH